MVLPDALATGRAGRYRAVRPSTAPASREGCNHADMYTGEIRVTGEDGQTQSWRHRGGAGSGADLEVVVR